MLGFDYYIVNFRVFLERVKVVIGVWVDNV